MIATITEIERLSFERVRFYSVRFDDSDESEFEKFWNSMSSNDETVDDLKEIFEWIKRMGNKSGAKASYFKFEDAAHAIPKYYQVTKEDGNYGVRLYCVRYSDSVVLLINGDQKTAMKVADCPNVKKHFSSANKIAKAIDQSIAEQEVIITTGKILFDNDYFIEI